MLPREDQVQSADVVIVGGGIVGSSIAYHLTAAGCRNVLVLERESAQGVWAEKTEELSNRLTDIVG